MTAKLTPRITLENRTPLQDVIPLSTPYLVFLDPCDKCNAACNWCPSSLQPRNIALRKAAGRITQHMEWDLYKKIIGDLCAMPEPIKTLRMYKDGESILNRRFPDMVKLAKDTGRFRQVDTTANGMYLNPSMNKAIVGAGLDKMFLSVPQGFTEKYIDNITHLFSISRGRMKIHAKIIGNGITDHRKREFLEVFSEISDSISIENLAPCWPGFDVKKADGKGIYGQALPDKEPLVCPYLFYSLAINSNGTVSLCFLDYLHQNILGDLGRETVASIWNGEKLKALRTMHLKGDRKHHPFCGNCQQLVYGAADNIDPYAREILERL